MVIGHKNPDTDSICSAIAYAHYKRHVAGVAAVPCRAGTVNPQTGFVLEFFGVPQPDLVTTLLPKLSDIMIQGPDLMMLTEDDPLGLAHQIITQRRFAFLPVTGTDGSYAGKISALRLASLLQDLGELSRKRDVPIHLHRFLAEVDGSAAGAQVPAQFTGTIWLAGLTEPPSPPQGPVLAVVPDSNPDRIAEAVAHGASVLVICNASHEELKLGIPVITPRRTAL